LARASQEAARALPSQATPSGADNLKEAISEVRGGNASYIELLVKAAGEKQAVPILEDLFTQSQSAIGKCFIASKLVQLGDGDALYWNYLVDMATATLAIPDMFVYDENGRAIKGRVSPEFDAWAKSQKVSGDPWSEEPIYAPSMPMGLLARTGDPRAVPLLKKGLLARNYLVEAMSATGLAELKDKDSIPLIVEACKRAPADAKFAIAMALLQYKDPEAQAAAEPYLPEDLVRSLHQEKR
jgi:hypothetical protein